MVLGKVMSNKGFYLGDVCYVLGEDVYYQVWGKENNYEDGIIEVEGTGFRFAVSSTAFGDGTYYDGEGHEYGVDAGVIGLVPLELVEKEDGLELGRVFEEHGTAEFEADDGKFFVTLPSGRIVIIDTKGDDEVYEDEEEEPNDDGWYFDIVEGLADDEVGFDPYLGCYTDDV